MQLADSRTRFGLISILNHWLTASLVFVGLGLGLIFEDMERGALKGELFTLHMAIGLAILVLGLARLVGRASFGKPEPAGAPAGWELRLARFGHLALMAMIVIMPLSGILTQVGEGRAVAFFGWPLIPAMGGEIEAFEEIGETVHGVGANLLMGLIGLHVLASLKHHLLDRDPTLMRMLGRAPALDASGAS